MKRVILLLVIAGLVIFPPSLTLAANPRDIHQELKDMFLELIHDLSAFDPDLCEGTGPFHLESNSGTWTCEAPSGGGTHPIALGSDVSGTLPAVSIDVAIARLAGPSFTGTVNVESLVFSKAMDLGVLKLLGAGPTPDVDDKMFFNSDVATTITGFTGGFIGQPLFITHNGIGTVTYDCTGSSLTCGGVVEDFDTVLGDGTFWIKTTSTGWALLGHSNRVGADHIDAITEIAAALKSGSDAKLITGTAGATDDCAKFNVDGDLVSHGTGCDSIPDGTIIEPDIDADNSPSDGDVLTYDSTGTNFDWITGGRLLGVDLTSSGYTITTLDSQDRLTLGDDTKEKLRLDFTSTNQIRFQSPSGVNSLHFAGWDFISVGGINHSRDTNTFSGTVGTIGTASQGGEWFFVTGTSTITITISPGSAGGWWCVWDTDGTAGMIFDPHSADTITLPNGTKLAAGNKAITVTPFLGDTACFIFKDSTDIYIYSSPDSMVEWADGGA